MGNLTWSWIGIAGGLALLVLGGELLVRGASRLAASLRISPLVIGLTVVAFGTSAPELAVSVQSALSGNADIALGNVVGSNIFNVLFILGVSALIVPLSVSSHGRRRDCLLADIFHRPRHLALGRRVVPFLLLSLYRVSDFPGNERPVADHLRDRHNTFRIALIGRHSRDRLVAKCALAAGGHHSPISPVRIWSIGNGSPPC